MTPKRLNGRLEAVAGSNRMINAAIVKIGGAPQEFDGKKKMFHVEQIAVACAGVEQDHQ